MKNEPKGPTHLFATVGALTERGGRVTTATSGLNLAGLEVACVGDAARLGDDHGHQSSGTFCDPPIPLGDQLKRGAVE